MTGNGIDRGAQQLARTLAHSMDSDPETRAEFEARLWKLMVNGTRVSSREALLEAAGARLIGKIVTGKVCETDWNSPEELANFLKETLFELMSEREAALHVSGQRPVFPARASGINNAMGALT